ncbi:MAG: 7-cyano-7-deazaguanine synthase [Thermoprotei archaeon]
MNLYLTQNPSERVAIVLFSGGLDSTVALWWALKKNFYVIPLMIDTGSRVKSEKEHAMMILSTAGIKNFINVNLDFVKDLFDLSLNGIIPYNLNAIKSPAYIPAKNLIFYSIAVYYAEIYNAKYIIGGHNADDSDFFPDATPEFFRFLNKIIDIGTFAKGKIKIVQPLIRLSKADIVKLGAKLGAPLDMTWSCQKNDDVQCGVCGSCELRRKAFKDANIPDLTEYKIY